MPSSEEKLNALLQDLHEFAADLRTQGNKKRLMAQQFEANARRDPANRDFDLAQARLLDYEHQLLHDIGNMVERLIKQYER
ncbi:MAG TPA: hypothetical protein VKV40_10735 [Ktedonobacteraceae bacterium]|nr:hypothetical protein [Ktedonobacteraceae bacterium]